MSSTASPTTITLKNILVATDLSPASLWSLPHVFAIAHRYGSAIYLANVIPLEVYGAARPESFDTIEIECHDRAQEKLERYSARVRAQDIPVRCLLDEGDVGLVIADWIKQYDIDLLAVGTMPSRINNIQSFRDESRFWVGDSILVSKRRAI